MATEFALRVKQAFSAQAATDNNPENHPSFESIKQLIAKGRQQDSTLAAGNPGNPALSNPAMPHTLYERALLIAIRSRDLVIALDTLAQIPTISVDHQYLFVGVYANEENLAQLLAILHALNPDADHTRHESRLLSEFLYANNFSLLRRLHEVCPHFFARQINKRLYCTGDPRSFVEVVIKGTQDSPAESSKNHVVEWIVDCGFAPSIHATTDTKHSLLHMLAKQKCHSMCEKQKQLQLCTRLLQHDFFKARINAVDSRGFSPLAWAVLRNNHQLMRLLIDNGADIKWRAADDANFTLVHLAAGTKNRRFARSDSNSTISLLSELNPEFVQRHIHSKDKSGRSPLQLLLDGRFQSVAEYKLHEIWLKNTSVLSWTDPNDTAHTLVHTFAEMGNADGLRFLQDKHSEQFKRCLNTNNNHGFSPLALSIQCGRNPGVVVPDLIAWGADIRWRHPTIPTLTLYHLAVCGTDENTDILDALANANSKYCSEVFSSDATSVVAMAVSGARVGFMTWLIDHDPTFSCNLVEQGDAFALFALCARMGLKEAINHLRILSNGDELILTIEVLEDEKPFSAIVRTYNSARTAGTAGGAHDDNRDEEAMLSHQVERLREYMLRGIDNIDPAILRTLFTYQYDDKKAYPVIDSICNVMVQPLQRMACGDYPARQRQFNTLFKNFLAIERFYAEQYPDDNIQQISVINFFMNGDSLSNVASTYLALAKECRVLVHTFVTTCMGTNTDHYPHRRLPQLARCKIVAATCALLPTDCLAIFMQTAAWYQYCESVLADQLNQSQYPVGNIRRLHEYADNAWKGARKHAIKESLQARGLLGSTAASVHTAITSTFTTATSTNAVNATTVGVFAPSTTPAAVAATTNASPQQGSAFVAANTMTPSDTATDTTAVTTTRALQ